MLFLYLFTLIFTAEVKKLRPCYSCVHYIPSKLGGKYDIGEYMGRCKKFADVQTNELDYIYAIKARVNETQCGAAGKFYELNIGAKPLDEYL
jgi:hypothetical protein